MLALFLQNFILITKKTPLNWLQLSTSWVLLGVQLAGQRGDDSLRYYLLAHSLNTKNLYLCVTCVFTTAYIWKPNCWGILIGYKGVLKSFSKDTTDFVVCRLLLFERISIDVYTGKAGMLILAFFDLSCFLILYLDCFHMVMLIDVLMRWSALPSTLSSWFSRQIFNRKSLS